MRIKIGPSVEAMVAQHAAVELQPTVECRVVFAITSLHQTMATYKRVLAIQEKAYGPDHAEVAITLTNMGNVLQSQGQLEAAMATYKRAEEIFVVQLGSAHPHTRQCRELKSALRCDTCE